jgi:hypothetical protein
MKIGVAFLLFAGSLCASAQNSEVQVNNLSNTYYPNEPSVCINKADTNMVIGGANINNHYVSSDGGITWENKTISSSYGVWGDPVLHSDIDGHIYFAHLSRTKGKDKDYGFIDRIVVQTSTNGGKTFDDGSYAGLNEPKMQDKPWISTDDYSKPYKGNAYLTWTEFDKINSKKKKHQSRIQFSASTDKGKTWSDAITISDSVGDAVDDDHTLEGATTAVDALGNIYCVWAGHHKLYFDKSSDGGKTWGRDRVLFYQESGWAMDIPHVYRSNGMPFLVVDNSSGKFTGRLYLVWGDDRLGDADVFLSYSDDQGSHWSVPKRVHRDAAGNGKSQYLPNIAIDQTTGHLAVVYYDRKESSANIFSDVYVSFSNTGGESFEQVRLNQKLNNHIGKEMFSGDYLDVDFHQGKISAIWAGFQGKPVVYCRSITEDKLYYVSPIHDVGQVEVYLDESSKYPELHVVATVGCEGKITYYKRRWFSKKFKVKQVEEFEVQFYPGHEGFGETSIKSKQKRRFKIEVSADEPAINCKKYVTIQRGL